MIREAIDRILALAENNVKRVGLFDYVDRPIHLVSAPKIDPITLNSLTGLVEYLRSGEIDSLRPVDIDLKTNMETKAFIHVRNSQVVDVFTTLEKNRRDLVVTARFEPSKEFQFGSWMSPEDFIIALKGSAIAPHGGEAADYNLVLRLASSISIEHLSTMKDSGLAQSVATKQGITYELTEVPPFIKLEFRRTFPEVMQYESEFFLRLRQVGDKVMLALFETTYDEWEIHAKDRIARWIKDKILAESAYVVLE